METGAGAASSAGEQGSEPVRLTRAAVRELDRLAVEEFGLPGIALMENAGAGAARIALAMLPPLGARCAILCGPGNNGGDGWTVARHLANRGVRVRIVSTVEPARLSGDAATMARVALAMRIPCSLARTPVEIAALRSELASEYLLVDALLGTGTTGAARTPIREAILLLADLGRTVPVLALDLPSGLDADSGEPLGACVIAARTATFAADKVGFAAVGAARWLGAVEVVDIGAPASLLARLRHGPLTGR